MTDDGKTNPFDPAKNPDRYEIWQCIVARDCEAFAVGDWSMIEADFDFETFEGIRCFKSTNPDDWRLVYGSAEGYRDAWIKMSAEFRAKRFLGRTPRDAIYARTRLLDIEIVGTRAICHKKFTGDLPMEDGTVHTGSSQTIYRLLKRNGRWKIVGFVGYLAYDPTKSAGAK
jgi:hypothetical protein